MNLSEGGGKNMSKEKFPTKLSMIWHFLRGSKVYFGLSILFACLVSLLELINPRIIAFTVDSVIDHKDVVLPELIQNCVDKVGGIAFLRHNLWIIAIVVVIVALLAVSCRYFFQSFTAMGSEKLVKTMRDDLFTHIMHLPFKWHSENHTGDIIQRCTSDVDTIKGFLSEQLIYLVRIIILIVLVLFFMFSINVKLALATSTFIPIIVGYSFFFHAKIGNAFEVADEEEGKLSSIAQENLTGVRVVRAFGREAYERERFEKQNEHYTNMWTHLMRLLSAFWMSSDMISNLQMLVVISYGAIITVNNGMSAGNYIAFIAYNSLLLWPVRSLGRTIANMSKAGISIDRLRYIMNSEMEEDKPNAVTPDLLQDIEFKNVSYQYENGSTEVLENVSFKIKAGTTFGILGGTGSGKSTLMYLLDRLYQLPDDHGQITIAGVDIRDMKAEWIRQNIGMVLQEPYLFSRSLSENIKIAKQSADMKEIRTAAKIASLDEAISHFKEGYNTYVGERGVTLSGGQKQRAAIAQMLIRKPPIMIFDDSLSAVDAETDAKIRAGLKDNISESTVILISHRITTLMAADHIIVLDKGRVVEEGTHEQLLEKQGIYRRIFEMQSQQSE